MFVAFNNRNATDVIPLMAPLIAPSARLLGPILNQIAASPVRSTVEVRHKGMLIVHLIDIKTVKKSN